jgi:serine protease Do
MNNRRTGRLFFVLSLAILTLAMRLSPLSAAEPLAMLEEQAIKAAVAHVAPSVVRIETVGGLERVGSLLVGPGSTTGLIVSADGYIVSSAFNFAQRPDSILITLAGGNRVAAKLVATDRDRKLVLLKVNVGESLPAPEAAPAGEIRVGAWAIALGRTFDGDSPNLSVGIVSAVDRIWGKALQTDAKISPSNYGGPLVDIRGHVLGVLSPLAPDEGSEVAGVDWYDSGIGFAVPLEHILAVLPRLREGHDLQPGMLGISFKSTDFFSQPAVIGACRFKSPAYQAGVKVGDEIIAADGRPVTRIAQLKTVIGSHYAGDLVRLTVRRGGESLELNVELADHLDPYVAPFLGILPLRGFKLPSQTATPSGDEQDEEAAQANPPEGDNQQPRADKDSEQGERKPLVFSLEGAAAKLGPDPLVIRYVYPGGPADEAGLKIGDVILKMGEKELQDKTHSGAAIAAVELRALAPSQTVKLEVLRGGEALQFDVKLGQLPESLPGELPPAHLASPPLAADAGRPRIGVSKIKLPEFKNECLVYVPDNYNPAVSHGLVIWLGAPGWRSLCAERDLILLAPKSAEPARWQPAESKFIRRVLQEAVKNYNIDRTRIVIHGQEAGGALAYVAAFANRDVVRGVAVVDAPLPTLSEPPENDPMRRLAIYTTRASRATFTTQLDNGIRRLRESKFPVTVKEVGAQGRYLTGPELEELARWIDTLDRL